MTAIAMAGGVAVMADGRVGSGDTIQGGCNGVGQAAGFVSVGQSDGDGTGMHRINAKV